MKKLFDYWDLSNDNYLKKLLTKTNVYDLPSYDEVISYLKTTDADEDFIEEVMGDLIIRFIEGDYIELEYC